MRVALSRVLNGQAAQIPVAISAEMAIRLDKAFGADMATLLRMQSAVGIARAKAKAPEVDVARYRPT